MVAGLAGLPAWAFQRDPVLTEPANNPLLVRKVFLPRRLHLGNTGIVVLQPIDEAAWIWHPDFAHVPPQSHGAFFSAEWHQPVLLRFRKPFQAGANPAP
jgi:hypothetical protein